MKFGISYQQNIIIIFLWAQLRPTYSNLIITQINATRVHLSQACNINSIRKISRYLVAKFWPPPTFGSLHVVKHGETEENTTHYSDSLKIININFQRINSFTANNEMKRSAENKKNNSFHLARRGSWSLRPLSLTRLDYQARLLIFIFEFIHYLSIHLCIFISGSCRGINIDLTNLL